MHVAPQPALARCAHTHTLAAAPLNLVAAATARMHATPLAGLSALLPTARVAAATARPGLALPLCQRHCNSGALSWPPRVATPRRPLLSNAAPPGLLAPLTAPRSRSPAAPVAPRRRSLSPATASPRLCPLAALGAAPPAAPLTHTR
nr:testis-specific gene A8 protein-like [Aegilops tauschii subsp. strangulata]